MKIKTTILIFFVACVLVFVMWGCAGVKLDTPGNGYPEEETTSDSQFPENTILEEKTPPVVPKIIDAPYIYQKAEYPNGCEAVSAVMALRYFGMDISVEDFIDNYLDMGPIPKVGGIGPDPGMVFCGDPRLPTGWGCYSPVIYNALGKFIDNSKYTVSLFSGRTLTDLCSTYIDNDIPVIIWATVGMIDSSADQWWASWTTPEGKNISYNKKLHCLLLVGYDEKNYYFNDPMNLSSHGTRYIGYSKATAERAYSILGKQSIVIIPVS